MIDGAADAILVLRRAAGLTQEELAARLGITQTTLSRYEHGLRAPDDATLERLGEVLGVTADLLRHGFRMRGATGADFHMRRPRTAKPAEWKRVEARVNRLRMHSTYLLERVPLRPQNDLVQVDPDVHGPEEAALVLRTAWRMPVGPVRNLVRWVESAGIVVVEEEFGTRRIDGVSQWAGDHAVVVLNITSPTDRKRWTTAHELAHLVLHNRYVDLDMEEHAERFAAELLMPAVVVRPQLRSLTPGKLIDLKVLWGVPLTAVLDRALALGAVTASEHRGLLRAVAEKGWRTREPGGDLIAAETPELAASVGRRLDDAGLTHDEVLALVGAREGHGEPFVAPSRCLRSVAPPRATR